MILNEARGNLLKIDNSFFKGLGDKYRSFEVSENSEVYVDKLKNTPDTKKHTWDYLIENVIKDDLVAFVVIRSNKRQLMLIRYNQDNSNFYIVYSDISGSESDTATITYTDQLKYEIVNKIVSFCEKNNLPKKWDVIVVKKDLNLVRKEEERNISKKGVEVKPFEKNYNEYISKLKDAFVDRGIKFIEKAKQNVSNINELMQYLNSNKKSIYPARIKIANKIFKLEDIKTIESGQSYPYYHRYAGIGDSMPTIKICVNYRCSQLDYNLKELRLFFNLKGYNIEFDRAEFKNDSFEEGIRKIINDEGL